MLKEVLALHLAPAGSECSGDFLEDGREGDFGGADGLRSIALELTAKQKAAALDKEFDLLKIVQAAHDLGPLGLKALLFHADFEFALENQGQEAAEDVAADGFVALMKDGTGLHYALCRAEGVFNHPEHLVNAGDSFRVVIGFGAQHEEAVVAFFLGDLFLIDSEVAASFDLKEPAVAFIADETLVPATQLLAQGLEDAGAIVCILSLLFFIETDDVTAALDFDFFDLERSGARWRSGVTSCQRARLLSTISPTSLVRRMRTPTM